MSSAYAVWTEVVLELLPKGVRQRHVGKRRNDRIVFPFAKRRFRYGTRVIEDRSWSTRLPALIWRPSLLCPAWWGAVNHLTALRCMCDDDCWILTLPPTFIQSQLESGG